MKPPALDSVKLLTLGQLADDLGVSYSFVKSMKAFGMPMPLGGRTTKGDALKWLRDNPEFSPGKVKGLRRAAREDRPS